METALKEVVVSQLRSKGFSGSLPHFRLRRPDRIDLLSFQFHKAGGSFCVEVASCGSEGYTNSWGKHIQPSKVHAREISSPRPRLGNADFPEGDYWFRFGPPVYEPGHDDVKAPEHCADVADGVLWFIDQQAEPFWSSQPTK